MSVSLQDLRRYAIEKRVEIKFTGSDAAGLCVITVKGQIRIPGEDKHFSIDDAVKAADSFEVIVEGKPKRFGRDSMSQTLKEASKKRGVVTHAGEED